jgi:TolA-binding protein
MAPDRREPKGAEPLEALNALARRARDSLEAPSPAEQDGEWARVSARLRAGDTRRGRLFRLGAGGALIVAAVAVVVLVPSLRERLRPAPPAALAYQIRGGTVVEGGYLREAGRDGIELRFAEGTQMSFQPGTRGRLRAVSSKGASVAIEHGKASFQVTPRIGAEWSVEVGPFLVTVKGTVFTVAWDVVTERFVLTLERGAVSVAGPISGGGVLLKEGQRLAVDLPRKQTIITESTTGGTGEPPEAEPAPASAAVEARRPGPSEAPPPRAPERAAPVTRPGTRRGWAQALAAGDWDRILADADRAGIRQTLAQASSDDLLALADAARYRLRGDLARDALLADRRRFPGSASALEAAYLLGRLAESRHGAVDQALQWYDVYLAGAAAGPYASEALGRKMMATNELHGAGDAHALAREYLRRFPGGSYAGAARALLSAPP